MIRARALSVLLVGLAFAVPLGSGDTPPARAQTPASPAPTPVASPSPPVPAPYDLEDLATRYRLDVRLRFSPAILRVTERIDIRNRGAAVIDEVHLSVLARAFDEMRVHEVRVDGEPVPVTYPDPADMLVPIPGGLAPGGRSRIDVRFTDRPKRDLDTSLRARLSKAEGLMVVADWYPLVSDGHGLRAPGDSQASAAADRITLDLVTDRPLVVAAPGRHVRERGRGRRHVYSISGARDFAFVVGPRLRSATLRTRDGVKVQAFASRPPDGRNAGVMARRALETFDDAYGPYPWRRFVIAPTPRRITGQEYPGITLIGQAWLEGPDRWERRWLKSKYPDRWLGPDYVLAHEVAHQWFYAHVGNDQLREPWIDEALAEFSAHHFFGPGEIETCAPASPRTRVSSSVYDFPDRPSTRGCGGYTEVVYRRGAVMIDGVRRLLGDKAFFAAMRRLVAEHGGGIADTREVVGAWLAAANDPAAVEAHLRGYLGDAAFQDGGPGSAVLEVEAPVPPATP